MLSGEFLPSMQSINSHSFELFNKCTYVIWSASTGFQLHSCEKVGLNLGWKFEKVGQK